MSAPVTVSGDGDHAMLHGALTIQSVNRAEKTLRDWRGTRRTGALDVSELLSLDTPGALLLCALQNQGIELTGVSREHRALLDLIGGLGLEPLPKAPSSPRWRELVTQLGKSTHESARGTVDVITFVGRAVSAIGHSLLHPHTLRLPSISRHIAETGIQALPIVGLMAVMISIVIGYQSVAQLRPYGGEDYTVNLVAVSILREMGVLITAIMVAGRSGSAFAAEIGVMRARDEVDALNVMGLDPMAMLVVPRVIALVVTLPLLTFFADMMGLFGGAMISRFLLDISPLQYVQRLHQAADANDLLVGLIKAPIFGFLIAIVGCMHGLKVRGSAESVGKETTRAVVKAIFVVIVLDALFSILFETLGI